MSELRKGRNPATGEEITGHMVGSAPLDSAARLGPHGAYIGDTLRGGGAFRYDPWEARGAGVADPNLTAWGRLGPGKSAAIKVYLDGRGMR